MSQLEFVSEAALLLRSAIARYVSALFKPSILEVAAQVLAKPVTLEIADKHDNCRQEDKRQRPPRTEAVEFQTAHPSLAKTWSTIITG